MTEEEPQQGLFQSQNYKKLKFNLFERLLLLAMLLVLTISSIDAIDGKDIGKSDALRMAKIQGQQGLMAATSK